MHRIAFAVVTILGIFITLPAWAQNEIVITQAKALAGNVTPGDAAGYPITLSQPGAYILGSNLEVPLNQIGIYANANNIDIDLNGFRLNGGNAAYHGVVSGYSESRIHGGVITQFKIMGIYIRGNSWTIEDMKIVRNGNTGIDAQNATEITVLNSVIASNGNSGVLVRSGVFKNNTISKNADSGIIIDRSGLVEGNYIEGNFKGLVINYAGVVTANSFIANQSYGIDNGPAAASITNNSLYNNNGIGPEQILGGNNVYGNTCIGKPC